MWQESKNLFTKTDASLSNFAKDMGISSESWQSILIQDLNVWIVKKSVLLEQKQNYVSICQDLQGKKKLKETHISFWKSS